MGVGVTETSEAPLTVAPLMQGSDKGREIGQVPGRDLGSRRQMIEAVGLGRAAPQGGSDTGFLGARQHGAGYRSRTRRPRPARCPRLLRRLPPALTFAVLRPSPPSPRTAWAAILAVALAPRCARRASRQLTEALMQLGRCLRRPGWGALPPPAAGAGGEPGGQGSVVVSSLRLRIERHSFSPRHIIRRCPRTPGPLVRPELAESSRQKP